MRNLATAFGAAVAAVFLLGATAAGADEASCGELRDRGFDACYQQNDGARAACADHCGRCGDQTVGCYGNCEHYCDSAYPEGCAFDLNACVSRCSHNCHEPACQENAGCKQSWCSKETVKQCSDTCQATWNSLASCRASWCGDGKARTACMDGCRNSRGAADACRKQWCGDGKVARECYREADAVEEQCRKQADAAYQACLHPQKK